MSILDSLIKQLYDSYFDYDRESMKKHRKQLDNVQDILESKFNNIRTYSIRREMFYETSIQDVRIRGLMLSHFRKSVESFVHLYGDLETLRFHLEDVLDIYFWNYSNYGMLSDLFGDLAIKEHLPITFPLNDRYVFGEYGTNERLMMMLDDLIGRLRDDILETMEIIDKKYYSPDVSQHSMEETFSTYKSNAHTYIVEDDFYSYEKEKGILDVELGFIPIHKIYYEVNDAYKELKMGIDELFDGDNGFSKIYPFFIKQFLKNHPDGNVDEELKRFPKYNIMETKFIPPEFNLCEEIYGDWWYIMKTPHHLSRWDYYYHDFSNLDGGD